MRAARLLLVLLALSGGCDDEATSPRGDAAPRAPDTDARVEDASTQRDASDADAASPEDSGGPDAALDPDASLSDTAPLEDSGADVMTLDVMCVPECEARACGEDGCGGVCGRCEGGEACQAGVCVIPDCAPGCVEGCEQGCFDLGVCTSAGEGALESDPSVYTAGVTLQVADAPASATVFYRAEGAAAWMRGHDAHRIPNGRLVSALFDLRPDADYEVQVIAGDFVACGAFRTLPEIPQHTTARTLYVAAGAEGGDGTRARPFGAIQAALDEAQAGDDVRVSAGRYHEAVRFARSGEAGAYIRLIGEPGAVLEGAPMVMGDALTWTPDGDHVFWSPWEGDPRYIGRDEARQYHYLSLADLRAGRGDDDADIPEGFFAENGRLYVRCLDAPEGHSWRIPTLNTGVFVEGQRWIWIEGMEIAWFGDASYAKGVDIRGAHDVIVRQNHVHDMPSPVWVRRGSERARIEGNRIHQSSVPSWPWAAVKGTDHENSAIQLSGGRGAIAAGNEIRDIFNGVYAGSFSEDEDPTIAPEIDVYHNRLRRVTDDGLEPEGACVNARLWGNTVDEVHNGISLAPITYGPVWVLRNRFTHYTESGFKVSNDSRGRVWLYHNTCWASGEDQNGMGVSGRFSQMVLRNNIIRGTRYALEMSQAAGEGNSLDYDNLHTTRGAPAIKWDNTRYPDLEALCAATGLECNGHGEAPGLTDPAQLRFGLSEGSPNVDRGLRIYGINDDFEGAGPDIGYLELGAPEVPALE